ncbi:MAG: septum formation initiator family protein, partial [Nocardioides sp.]|nr:septum formation initiator family protein [Nocardioides sp.]
HLEQQRQIESLQESIASSEAAIEDLQREKRRWKDDAYVETQARKRFGFVMPGETSYQVIGRDGEPLAPEASLTDPGAVEEDVDDPWWEKAWGTVEAAGDPEHDGPAPAEEIRAPRKKRP